MLSRRQFIKVGSAGLLGAALVKPSPVHWHGLRIDNAMDGVPDMTQPPVLPGQRADLIIDMTSDPANRSAIEVVIGGIGERYGYDLVCAPPPP